MPIGCLRRSKAKIVATPRKPVNYALCHLQPSDCRTRFLAMTQTGRALNGWSVPRKSLNFQFQSSPLSCLRWSAPTRGEACKKEAEHSAEQQHKLRRSVKRRNALSISYSTLGDPDPAICSYAARPKLVTSSVNPSADRRHVHFYSSIVEATHPDGRRRDAGTPANRQRCRLFLKFTAVFFARCWS